MAAPAVVSRPPRLTKKWEPTRWEPIYEQFVALSCIGYSNKYIADLFKYTPVHISNVLNSKQGKKLKALILERLRSTVTSTIDKRLEDIADKTVERLTNLVNDDELFDKSPFAVVDRGIAVLKGLSHLKPDDTRSPLNINKALILSDAAASTLARAMEKSDRAKEIRARDTEHAEPAELIDEG